MSALIIAGTDGSIGANAAVGWAADDAARTGLPLRIVTAVHRWPNDIPRFAVLDGEEDAMTRAARKVLAEAEATARTRRPTVEVSTALVEGPPPTVLRDQARDAAEIVIGSRGLGGLAGAVIGSVSTHVAGHAHCPVVVVHPGQAPSYGEITVGVDDSDACEPALAYAFEQARYRGCTLRVLYAWQLPVHAFAPEIDYDMDEIRIAQYAVAADRLASWRQRYPEVGLIEDVRCAHPVEALVEASTGADLLVVGSHGRGALGSLLLGSVSRGVLHHAHCAVAVVRS
ncbi:MULTISPECIES: universal stress protein [unclassified Streptosporangium]|uniref:universal stress protein n=1 Tax=unclassified Streptosporangium TaxID=2632669 RepID=UPI002E2A8167|nr:MULTISPECIES: universal stress protein [unclassified Streptosporangium]